MTANHPYPAHIVEAVAEALWRTTDGSFVLEWGDISEDVRDYQYTKAITALAALWNASRIETFDALEVFTDEHWDSTITLVDARGTTWPLEDYELIPVGGYPVHVIHWGNHDR